MNVTEISQKSSPDNSMLEESPVSRLCLRPNWVEDSEEAKKGASSVVGVHVSPEQGPMMSNCSEPSLSGNDTSTSQSSLQHHFVSLREQMARRKAEYEAKISR